MKKKNILLILACGLGFTTSCMDLDINPLSQATNENWFASEAQFEMSANELLREGLWNTIDEKWTDDICRKNELSNFQIGNIDGESWEVSDMWGSCYRAIGHCNAIIEKLNTVGDKVLGQEQKNQYMNESLFVRACMYSKLITLFGDVPYTDTQIDIETAMAMGRTPKSEVLQKIYADFDTAIEGLPISNGSTTRPTKGAAYGMKARIALYNEDWNTAIEAAQACMNLGVYKLHPSYRELFLQNTHNTEESVFSLARSINQDTYEYRQDYMPRNNGGWAVDVPTWDLLAAYLCTDGLPIDESPLFDPHNPFKNRDPRCNETIVAFGENWLGYEYDPRPDTGEFIIDYKTDKEVKNNDNKINQRDASYNGLILKKGLDETITSQNGFKAEPDLIVLRYADVLLMYAEAKIEKGDIDQSVLNAINQVRARAYGVDVSATGSYPAITTTEQNKLRTILRIERRMEFAFENKRFYDLLRWRLFDKVFNIKNYGMYLDSKENMKNFIDNGAWFWAITPDIDENGIADFSALEVYGINSLAQRSWDDRQYLWPIPTTEITINENMKQNDGY